MAGMPSRNGLTALAVVIVVAGMVGMSFAAVPLYQLFCQVTGFGGTTQVAEQGAGTVGDRKFTVTLDGAVNPDLPWTFEPVKRKVTLKEGESVLAYFKAKNLSARTTTGVAVFNVTPYKTGPYFNKVQCFCFNQQTLQPGEEVEMPVTFFVDPGIDGDRNLDDVTDITLSYTFFRAAHQASREAPSPQGDVRRTF